MNNPIIPASRFFIPGQQEAHLHHAIANLLYNMDGIKDIRETTCSGSCTPALIQAAVAASKK